jgi:hypothetical protein
MLADRCKRLIELCVYVCLMLGGSNTRPTRKREGLVRHTGGWGLAYACTPVT